MRGRRLLTIGKMCSWLGVGHAVVILASCNSTLEIRDDTESRVLAAEVNGFVQRGLFGVIESRLTFAGFRILRPVPRLECGIASNDMDSNANLIPDSATIEYNGANCPPIGSGAGVLRGRVRIQDLGAPWGVRMVFDPLSYSQQFGGEQYESIRGSLTMRRVSDTTVLVFDSTVSYFEQRLGTISSAQTRRYDTRLQFVGITVAPSSLGPNQEASVEGTLVLTGSLINAADSVQIDIATTQPLKRSLLNPCFSPAVAGSLTAKVRGTRSADFTITYSC